ncbi:helix-turn-helix domain-containing protein [Salegentibacter sp. JZCK2]|uniref:helix-turn-helix transcriptional regulator n=1 Tax=Salegentibacter tibetensis TaxID=2873600 RepID=UPI001CCD7422|nr:helix-turn-helix transcriptional regulator [Salegentibacter tibetensis]MBZ9730770.1 helix-turn-helix domain-containing protein [Salegentibacter tibetensis]
MTEKEKIGKQVLKLRERLPSKEYDKEKISQQELADTNFGLTKHLIGTVERGDANPTLEKMMLLAKALKVRKIELYEIEIDVNKFIDEINSENN